jgi:hypothetical protein
MTVLRETTVLICCNPFTGGQGDAGMERSDLSPSATAQAAAGGLGGSATLTGGSTPRSSRPMFS